MTGSAERPAGTQVYVNERGVMAAHGSTALDAVRLIFPEQADAVVSGSARLTDSRGLPIEHQQPVSGGLILRVLPVRATSIGGDA